MPEKYIGRIVNMIYQDKDGQLSQRRIRVSAIDGGKVRAYDYGKRAPRIFEAERILAIQPIGRSA